MFDKIQPVKDKKIAIWMHESPDPDAIGSALGLAWLLKREKDMNCDLFHVGTISHPENRSLMNVLSLSFKSQDEYDNNLDSYAYTFVVDSTEENLGHEVIPDAIIDHHRAKIIEENYHFVLNKQVGACASLIYELIEQSSFELTEDDAIQATALLFGILTDTNYLLSDNTSDLDFKAFSYFRERANTGWIQEIRSYPIPAYFFDYEVTASDKKNKVEKNGTLISFLGVMHPERRGVLPYLADRLMRKEAIDTTVIMAIVDNRLEASVRSKKVSLDVDEFVRKIFGDEHAGGKRGAGGAKVPMGIFRIPEDDKELRQEISEVTKNMIISKIEKEIIKDG